MKSLNKNSIWIIIIPILSFSIFISFKQMSDSWKVTHYATVTFNPAHKEQKNAKAIIKALKSSDSAVFMPAVRTLAENDKKDLPAGIEQSIPFLEKILEQNKVTPYIKETTIQALCIVAGDSAVFKKLSGWKWEEVFFDCGSANWKEKWQLDGEKAKVVNTELGMELYAGPEPDDDASHAVLWTKESYSGDLMIEYEYTRLDSVNSFVNIIYIQATGSGEFPYIKNIKEWSALRKSPAMNLYFGKMFTYHVSYAVGNTNRDKPEGYIRARRYIAGPLGGTELEPDYSPEGLFHTNVENRFNIIKTDKHLFVKFEAPGKTLLCHWYNDKFPPITEGYIGLRHMCTRNARYANFKISKEFNPI